MARHSYTRCWLHLVWCTRERMRIFTPHSAAKVSAFISQYAAAKHIYHKINYVNPEHVHVLIDLPCNVSIEQAAKLLKGASSHWINESRLVAGAFNWARGYAAFSVSHSNAPRVAAYIAGQEEHHRVKSFDDEYSAFVRKHGLRWYDDSEETVENSFPKAIGSYPLAEARGE